MKYKNPVIPGFYPDPSICRVGEDYYLVNSSFAYVPGVPIWHSKDLVHWRQIGYCLTRKSQLQLNNSAISGGIFAPTLRFYNGRFFMVTTNIDQGGHFYVWANNPAEEWSDPIYVDQPGIDPSLFFDDDGKVFFTSTSDLQSKAIYQCEIDIETGQKLSDTQMIWEGTGGAFPEGPHLYKINGYYYLMCAEGGTEYGHMVTIARSKTPYGPFESYPGNPILSHRSLNHKVHATGHADLIEAQDGTWWAVFLGIRPIRFPYRHHLGRETFLAPVSWTDDDWPIIGNNGVVELEMDAETLPFALWEEEPEVDHFDQPKLGLKWNFIRNSYNVDWSLKKRDGWLAFSGSEVRLIDSGTPAFIGCRQQHFQCDVSTKMEFDPQEGDEAGLAVFMNEGYHYTIGLTKVENNYVILFRKQVGSMTVVEHSCPIKDLIVELRIQATPEKYIFSYCNSNQRWQYIGEGETQFLSTEVAGGFTGVFFGMYNYSTNRTVAYYDWFQYRS
ncbi:glycoside hydrolase family 43 protein [Bacillus timonensis]|uniref:Glycoside hydrolase family 43 protein n=1 Tax=Bacillus timonensis TaxID=1033734 RepID=A0A4S3PQC4_9BACI|nr:glycoside hydrolase family 43 protein [Bacillus timonensis]THE11851.1 glycoside hydrolase family 43 protein [Bacillus timonensis]